MKRCREDDDERSGSYAALTSAAFSPVHPSAQHHAHSSAPVSMSPWKQQPLFGAFQRSKPAPMKRFRDRSVPIDAMSRMMSAAVTSARIKKHSAQLQALSMLPSTSSASSSASACCSVCESGKRHQRASPAVDRCGYCEKLVGACCIRDCESCFGQFCSLCSTLNCDQQFDRTLCWSCNDAQSS